MRSITVQQETCFCASSSCCGEEATIAGAVLRKFCGSVRFSTRGYSCNNKNSAVLLLPAANEKAHAFHRSLELTPIPYELSFDKGLFIIVRAIQLLASEQVSRSEASLVLHRSFYAKRSH